MATERFAWLDLTPEAALEPELPICDPHHHLWDHPEGRIVFNRYLLEDLMLDTRSGHNIVQTVFVECSAEYRSDGPEEMKPVGETEFVQRIAEENANDQNRTSDVAVGIVGYADLTFGDGVANVLEAHIEAGKGRFRGIRQSTAWDASDDISGYKNPPKLLLADESFRKGFAHLQRLGLSFDALVYHPQIPELSDLAKSFPDVTIIANHIAGPLGIGPYAASRDEAFEDWKRNIAGLSQNSNVVMKLGGIGMPLSGFDWHKRDKPIGSEELATAMAPYYLWCIEQFGPDRCMYESNFPVDKNSYSYTVMWNAAKRLTKDFSIGERANLFRETAIRAYRL